MTVPSLPVAAFMSSPVQAVFEATPLADVERKLAEHRISSMPVVDSQGHPVGVVSRFDLLRVGRLRARNSDGTKLLEVPKQPASKIMHREVVGVPRDASVLDAARLMIERGIHRVFVVERHVPIGVLSTRDVMRAVEAARIELPVERWMSFPVIAVPSSDTVGFATDRLAQAHVTGVVVVEDGWPIGLFTQREALEARDLPADTPVDRVMTYALLCMPLGTATFRAAGHAAATRAQRVLMVERREVRGILTGLDFARALLDVA